MSEHKPSPDRIKQVLNRSDRTIPVLETHHPVTLDVLQQLLSERKQLEHSWVPSHTNPSSRMLSFYPPSFNFTLTQVLKDPSEALLFDDSRGFIQFALESLDHNWVPVVAINIKKQRNRTVCDGVVICEVDAQGAMKLRNKTLLLRFNPPGYNYFGGVDIWAPEVRRNLVGTSMDRQGRIEYLFNESFEYTSGQLVPRVQPTESPFIFEDTPNGTIPKGVVFPTFYKINPLGLSVFRRDERGIYQHDRGSDCLDGLRSELVTGLGPTLVEEVATIQAKIPTKDHSLEDFKEGV